MTYLDSYIHDILNRTKTIALVGFSANPARPSHGVARFLISKGYRVIPVNPGLAGQIFFDEKVYPDLTSIPDAVDFVDIFRRSEAVPDIVDEALARWPDLRTIWMQLDVIHEDAAAVVTALGVDVVQDRCPAIEYPRLIGARPKPQHT